MTPISSLIPTSVIVDNPLPVATSDPCYVPWGHHETISMILTSGIFAPIMMYGDSGSGKTFMATQIAARLNRPAVRVNITRFTDEYDLLGGYRLEQGTMHYDHGPVLRAAIHGAVLVLDELDQGGAGIMCLLPVLEGKPFYVTKWNQWVTPAPGFAVIATGNTDGRGDTTGDFTHTTILNRALRERFPVTLQQGWPPPEVEGTMLRRYCEQRGYMVDACPIDTLVAFAQRSRAESIGTLGRDARVATRHLMHICLLYGITRNWTQAVSLGVSSLPMASALTALWNALHTDTTT